MVYKTSDQWIGLGTTIPSLDVGLIRSKPINLSSSGVSFLFFLSIVLSRVSVSAVVV